MGGNSFQSIGDILNDIKNNPEKVHEHNINRLIQEFGKKYESEVIGIYNMERSIVENGNSIPLKIISTRIYERAQETLYFNNPDHVPPDNLLSDRYI
tara:strand:- start:85 stop:375 length:291 start_codon:yes stop_codon:yes gene_type:complete